MYNASVDMKLENQITHIHEIQFGAETSVSQGVLSVNREELEQLLLADKRLGQVEIDAANAGEKCRIARVTDVFEPRAKAAGSGIDFPGALGGPGSAGSGVTRVLRGSAVAVSEYREVIGDGDSVGEFIDTWGDGADYGQYGKLCNLSVLPFPADSTTLTEYRIASKLAGLKTAVYLAAAGREQPPDETEIFELDRNDAQPGLPRIAYIFQVLTNQFEPLRGDPVLYGDNIERIVPTVLHPNEVLDGALIAPHDSRFMETYTIQNHPVVLELYRNHGKTLDFAGVIITNAPNNVDEFERAATIASNLARWTLRADGVVLTKIGGGAPELTMARMAQRCEELGLKTALAFLHMGIDATDTNLKPVTIFNAPEIDAMVSMGAPVTRIAVPAPDRVIGIPGGLTITGESIKQLRQIKGAFSQIGASRLTAIRY